MCKIGITFAQNFLICAMETIPSFISYIEQSIKKNWDYDALTDYKGITLQYKDVARKIEKLHIIFEHCGIQKGDKIALCGRNSCGWAVAFFATLTYGAVAVPIQHEFKPEQIYHIVEHSESKLLLVGDVVSTTIDPAMMPNIEGVIYLPDFSLICSRNEKLDYVRENLNALFGAKYPKYFRPEHVIYHKDEPEELAIINYTSGTTGFSKGVMIPYRAMWSNLDFAFGALGSRLKTHSNVLSILPMAHMYGQALEFIFNFCYGNHIFFLTRLPSPSTVATACDEIHPVILITVPMVVEKIIRKRVLPKLQQPHIKMLMNMPVISKKVKQKVCEYIVDGFGGNIYEIIVGGAALNNEIEQFLLNVGFPFTVGYGTTETAPMISYCDYTEFVPGTCGKIVPHMEMKVLSEDPENIEGEVLARGMNVMLGYYKNEEATKAVIDNDGWYHTGDRGTINSDGYLFIRGRIKNMLLGSNGQNIYPEEIENRLNSMPLVSESLIIQEDDHFVGLVYPDKDGMEQMGFAVSDVADVMEQNRVNLNVTLPSFSKISEIRLREEEFEKTPKKSIKRYLYN